MIEIITIRVESTSRSVFLSIHTIKHRAGTASELGGGVKIHHLGIRIEIDAVIVGLAPVLLILRVLFLLLLNLIALVLEILLL